MKFILTLSMLTFCAYAHADTCPSTKSVIKEQLQGTCKGNNCYTASLGKCPYNSDTSKGIVWTGQVGDDCHTTSICMDPTRNELGNARHRDTIIDEQPAAATNKATP
jgi:hypothetical protein